MPQSINVDGAPAFVGLDDDFLAAAFLDVGQPGEDQVALDDADDRSLASPSLSRLDE